MRDETNFLVHVGAGAILLVALGLTINAYIGTSTSPCLAHKLFNECMVKSDDVDRCETTSIRLSQVPKEKVDYFCLQNFIEKPIE